MRLSFKTKISYGIGGLADNAMFSMASTFLLFFLTSVAGIAPGIAGIIVAVGCIWEVICGPVVGSMSDILESRYGKRKPFLIFGGFPAAIFTALLFHSVDATPAFKIAYYFIMTLMFWMSFSSYFVPYMAWGSELTEDYQERTVLRSYAYIFNQVGAVFGMVLPSILVDTLMQRGFTLGGAWSWVGISVGLACALALWICAFSIKESDNPDFVKPENAKSMTSVLSVRGIISMFSGYGKIISLRPVRILIAATLSFLIANTFYCAARVYYYTYNVGFTAPEVSLLMIIMTVGGMALTPVVAACCRKFDKKYVFIVGMAVTGVMMIVMRFTVVETLKDAIIQCVVFTTGNTCYWQLIPSILYDVCEAEELASGEKHSGQVISLQALSESLSTAISSALLGFVLQCAGFSESLDVQSPLTLSWINHCFTLFPGIVMVMTALILWRYPIDKKRFEAILAALELRRSGGEPDMLQFKDIYGGR